MKNYKMSPEEIFAELERLEKKHGLKDDCAEGPLQESEKDDTIEALYAVYSLTSSILGSIYNDPTNAQVLAMAFRLGNRLSFLW